MTQKDVISFVWTVMTSAAFCTGNGDKKASAQIDVRAWEGFPCISKLLKYNGSGIIVTTYDKNMNFKYTIIT